MTTRERLAPTYVVRLPWTRPPLSLNDRGGWQGKHRDTQAVIDGAWRMIRAARLPRFRGTRVTVTLHYRVPDMVRRDTDNLAATLKACMDALVDEGAISDDSWVHVPHTGQTIHPPSADGPAMWLEVAPCG